MLKKSLQLKPTKLQKFVRNILHGLTLFPKVFFGFLFNIIFFIKMLLSKATKSNERSINVLFRIFVQTGRDQVKTKFLDIFNKLPIFKNSVIELYCPDNPIGKPVNCHHHNVQTQAAQHGIYSFLSYYLGQRNEQIHRATMLHLNGSGLFRGFKLSESGYFVGSMDNVQGDQLLGIALSILGCTDELLRENFEIIVSKVIENDFALPTLIPNKKKYIILKSKNAMWEPGLSISGSKAIMLLAILKMSGEHLGAGEAQRTYDRLVKRYGYGLLSLFPITEDNNSMIAAYILAKLSKSTLSKWYWLSVMLMIWLRNYKLYNGWFAGLINDVSPNLISLKYINICKSKTYDPLNQETILMKFASAVMSDPLECREFLSERQKIESSPEGC